ncbi:sulfurtransferase [Microbacterium algihabitans]|uniref:sulfurtransferase n=1 Tax=Microbacterium algihabitans TaxID=3075992 RepID=UPI00345F3F7F
MPTLTVDGTQELLDAGEVVIDAQKAERFASESPDEDGNRGRIPGAIRIPASSLLDRENGTLRDASAVRERLGRLGVVPDRPVGVYCGGGVAAALATLALTEAGYPPRLFVGSFSAWASDPSRLVEPAR